FLRAAIDRLTSLGGDGRSVAGVEADRRAFRATVEAILPEQRAAGSLLNTDFFKVDHRVFGRCDVVVGNPPFIRYQRFTGDQRMRALTRAAAQGVKLSRLTSSWAPFLVHASSLLNPDGRLAMVAPAELCQASYARPVLRFLREHFGSVWILTFDRKMFSALSEDTVLVLAEGYGAGGHELSVITLPDISALEEDARISNALPGTPTALDPTERLALSLLPEPARELYVKLRAHPMVLPLGAVASASIGYVTGNNSFFH